MFNAFLGKEWVGESRYIKNNARFSTPYISTIIQIWVIDFDIFYMPKLSIPPSEISPVSEYSISLIEISLVYNTHFNSSRTIPGLC